MPVAAAGAAAGPGLTADLVLRNGAVYTVDAARSWAETIAIRGDRIVFVGSDREGADLIGARLLVKGACDGGIGSQTR